MLTIQLGPPEIIIIVQYLLSLLNWTLSEKTASNVACESPFVIVLESEVHNAMMDRQTGLAA